MMLVSFIGRPTKHGALSSISLKVLVQLFFPASVQDIDTEEDWFRAELMHQLLEQQG